MLYFARWKILLILAVSLLGILLTIPNFLPQRVVDSLPESFQREIVLGLDLQGGSHLLLGVETDVVVSERLDTLRDDVRQALRDDRIGYTGLGIQGQAVQVRLRDVADREKARTALNALAVPVSGSLFGGGQITEVEVSFNEPDVFLLTLSEQGLQQRISSAVDQSIEIVRRRIDELGTTEPLIQRQGTDRILVQVPGLEDPARLKDLIGTTAKLAFRLVDLSMPAQQAIETRPPAESEVLYSTDDPPQPYVIQKRVMVAGEDLVDAQPGFDQRTNEPIVTFRFNTSGARKFGAVTQQNVGRPFAIVLDEQVISAPVIREPILGGTGQISGSFTVEGANDLAILLRAGALPAPLTILEERTVGPGLGSDNIIAGETAAIIGALLVLGFMLVAYGLFGIFANIALAINVMMLLGALTLLQATLTLPGIAGIALTIGMAVDANVLIYERIREEINAGRSAISSIDSGYRMALGTILDANITTLIVALILFNLGSGPVRGFAVTLAIGILTSVFSAFTLNRLIVSSWLKWRRPTKLPI
ncbi:protein translocase subunit SecD [Tepidamorphus sp. 3E244]|uniref:protein translocase subunit SecD n=1 Tax=Tepidamorphus sp. 3E244 TaxID=3385498 RepID=UPI0038FC76B5